MQAKLLRVGALALFLIFILSGLRYYQYLGFDISENSSKAQDLKIFQIGFDKCGTSTLYNFFKQNGISSIHYDNVELAKIMLSNYQQNKKLLHGKYANITAFFDMEHVNLENSISIPLTLFKELDQQYPGSKFILNTRNKQAWIRSRARHPHGKQYYLLGEAEKYHLTPEQIMQKWSLEWDQHHAAVLGYFKNRPQDLLVFYIDTDRPEKLVEFFKDNFRLNPSFYTHQNMT